ncbi:MAG: transglycosylase SLT domain-containing protein [Prevotella sp.]|nr:transglycosylase SLT domain-containing protein [Prevotella sp.]
MMLFRCLLSFLFLALLAACERNDKPQVTPWGTVVGDSVTTPTTYTLQDMVANGEIIMLTLSGPDTYYDYRGQGMGTQYLLFRQFTKQLGVSLRVDLCKDTTEMLNKLEKGEGDIIVYPLGKAMAKDPRLIFCGAPSDSANAAARWAVSASNKALADSIDQWYRPERLAQVQQEERQIYTARYIKRHVYSPILNRQKGVLSSYDHLFKRYAPTAMMDWRLLAAQCYQESAFDAGAKSWAGACGLMQLMPATAARHGLSSDQLFHPEANVATAARHLSHLNGLFRNIVDREERTNFILAAYNAGYGHVQDAMTLARKNNRNPHRWSDVSHYILMLSNPEYYRLPEVRHGYMRGTETFDYVRSIRMRYDRYRGVASGMGSFGAYGGYQTPHRATKNHRFGR